MSGARGNRWSLRAAAHRLFAAIRATSPVATTRRGEGSLAGERAAAGRRSKPAAGEGARFALLSDPREVAGTLVAEEGGIAHPALPEWIERARRSRIGGRNVS